MSSAVCTVPGGQQTSKDEENSNNIEPVIKMLKTQCLFMCLGGLELKLKANTSAKLS